MIKESVIKNSLKNVVAFVAAAVILSSCSADATPADGMDGGAPPETGFLQLNKGDAVVDKTYPGTIEGSENVDVKAQVTGYLEAIYVKEGEFVQKGQSLFRIKGDVFRAQVNSSQAALEAALAAQANAKLEIEKLKPLVEGKVVTDMQLRTAQANYDAATAQVAEARATVESSRLNAGFAHIIAPVSGYIGRIPNRIGNLVSPGEATPLTTLSEINHVFVYFSMSEADFISYSKTQSAISSNNQYVELVLADGSAYGQKGKLEAASGNIDRTTGSMAMKATFPNPQKLLRAGGSARVIIRRPVNEVIEVPVGSVKDIQDQLFVYRLTDSNKVAMTQLKIGGRRGNFYLVKEGLQAGDKVAIDRIDVLTDGMEVKPVVKSLDSIRK